MTGKQDSFNHPGRDGIQFHQMANTKVSSDLLGDGLFNPDRDIPIFNRLQLILLGVMIAGA